MITLVQPYYNHKETFKYQFKQWSQFSTRAKENFEIIVVDDGSPDFPCTAPANVKGVDLKILRIEDEILWNTAGAANLGITEAKYDWVIHADFDHGISPLSAEKFLNLDMSDLLNVYWPMRWYETLRYQKYSKRHINGYLMSKETFWKTGGYDEDFGGAYGYQDCLFRYDLSKLNVNMIETDENGPVLDRLIRCEDAHCQNVARHHQNGELYVKKRNGKVPRNYNVLNFNWHQVYPNE